MKDFINEVINIRPNRDYLKQINKQVKTRKEYKRDFIRKVKEKK
jgi:hypothetical protein